MNKACILSISGAQLTSGEKTLFATQNPWGVILMGRSCVSKTQIRALVSDIWNATGRETLIFIDQEGGRVARLKAPEWPLFPRGEDYALLYKADPERGREAAWLGHRLIAAELASMSIHADCAPVVDLPVPGAHDVIGDRAFGTEPEQVADLARAALKGLADGGVAGVVKHIPGHGRSMSDSHLELPRVMASEQELAKDFDAFARLADAPMAMTAHIAYDAIDPGVAATLSQKLIQGIIRERIGFDGLLMSDDLGMRALGGSLTTRADGAIAAGCDMLLHCSGFLKDDEAILAEMTEVAEASPLLAGKALQRADRAEAMATNEQPFDAEAGWARFHQLFPDFRAMA
ncbi:MAG: beta-N-acetylhexosaminidase [Hyphomonas oceanitis]|uniref:beta-N-acetylhexosaminidase n=1 Tax=Hyphomonas oceanitis SCH89 TaxID=1280953 RepID=A0A059G2N6_9PROT|nr:beta-N-acetylhexosaminidase [Hyphomonas oceanitis]KDA00820.1 beta-hexosaminidase [Hyphomonas oceanitis SCH89]